jgi:hypothetical protein
MRYKCLRWYDIKVEVVDALIDEAGDTIQSRCASRPT